MEKCEGRDGIHQHLTWLGTVGPWEPWHPVLYRERRTQAKIQEKGVPVKGLKEPQLAWVDPGAAPREAGKPQGERALRRGLKGYGAVPRGNRCLGWPVSTGRWFFIQKRMTEDEMAGWHHRLEGHGFGWTPGVGDGQQGLVCCGSWGRRVGHDWATDLNWTWASIDSGVRGEMLEPISYGYWETTYQNTLL